MILISCSISNKSQNNEKEGKFMYPHRKTKIKCYVGTKKLCK